MSEPRQPLPDTVVQGRTGGTNLVRVGVQNRALVLDLVRRRGPFARAELMRATGLSAQTVSNIAAGLVAAGLVREAPGGGRRLEVVAGSRSAIGVHLDPAHLVVVRTDLTGAVLAVEHVDLDATDDPARTLDTMAAAVHRVRGDGSRARSRTGVPAPAGIGLAVPGSIDPDGVRMGTPAQLPAWWSLPVTDELAARTGLPVRLEKDGVASALGEVWSAAGADDLVSVFLGHGISAATVAAGEVVRGATGNAGEFGGMPVEAHGRWTEVWEACQPLQQVRRGIDAGLLPPGIPLDRASDVRHAFERLCATPAAAPLVAEAGAALGSALAHVVELLDVPRVVIGGSAALAGGDVFIAAVRERLAVRLPNGPFPTVAATAFGEASVARGAACAVLQADLAVPAPVGRGAGVATGRRPGGPVHVRSIAHPW
ncbi:ROK family transcriptional regulator [Curtobacterium sp. VKM Ac-2887]|uniref:ROK family transcriptional regulator n=1 Tax=Curtobacterium sp. VKM Ac-2887 TaxID=2783819 RepID=UPI00188ADBF0|nr:ROK family transcriptional regulator [Curtobacterium sp. VKM Ac-2887]MBF4585944.1 ROK family transcriptional regulator [Curtobacterium sp. VKM Ac-2887]